MSVIQLTLASDVVPRNRTEAPHLGREVVEGEIKVVVRLMMNMSTIWVGVIGAL